MSDLEQLRKWCSEARTILKTTGSKKGKAAEKLDLELDKVIDGLSALVGPLKGTALLAELERMADRISNDAEILSKAPMTKKKEEAERRDQAKQVTKDLHELAGKIATARPLAQQLEAFRTQLDLKQKNLRSLETRPYVTEAMLLPLKAALEKAEAAVKLDDLSTVATGVQLLFGYDTAVKQFVVAQEGAQKVAAKNVRAQFDCAERLRVVRETLAHAKSVGIGVGTQIAALEKAIEGAEKCIDEEKWSEALALLPTSLPTVSQIDKASKSNLGELPPLAGQAQELLAQYRLLVDDELHAAAAQALAEKLQQAVGQPGKAPKFCTEAKKEITDTLARARLALGNAEADELEARKAINTATPSLDVVVLQTLNGRLAMLRTDIEQKHLLRAERYAKELLTDAQAAAQTARENRQGWNAVADGFAGLVQQVADAALDADAPPAEQAACRLSAEAAKRSRSGLEQARDWAGLLALHQGLNERLAAFAKAKQAYADFALLRNEGKALMAREFEALTAGLEKVEVALGKAPGIDAETVLTPLRARLASAFNVWEERLANATSTPELDAAGMEKLLTALSTDIQAAAKPEGIESAKTAQAEAAFEKTFHSMVVSLEQVFAKLDDIDIVRSAQAREKLERLQADTATTWEDKLPLLEEIAAGMQKALKEARDKQAGRTTVLLQTCTDLEQRTQVQLKKLKSTKDKAFKPAFEELLLQIKDQRALASTPNVNAADAVEKALAVLDRKLRGIEAMSADGSAFAKVRDMLAKVLGDLDEAKSLLQDNVPALLKTLQESAKELETSVLSMSTEEAFDAMGKLQTSIDEAKEQAAEVKTLRSGYNQLKLLIEQKIELLRSENTVPALVKVLQQRLDNIDGQAAKPDKLFGARQQLDQLHKDIEAAFLDPAKGLEMQKKARQSEEDQRLLKEQCEAGLAHVNKVALARAKKAVDDAGGDESMLQEIARMVGETEDIVKRKDYAEGARKVALVLARIEEVVADPYGPGIGSRKALPQGAQQYAASVNKLIKLLQGLPQAAVDRLARLQPPVALPDAARSKLAGQIEGLSRRLNPALFDEPAVQLQDSKKPARDRRAVREESLQQLRDLRALLSDHPQFVALWDNPFNVDIKVGKIEVLQRLTALEANIRRAVQ